MNARISGIVAVVVAATWIAAGFESHGEEPERAEVVERLSPAFRRAAEKVLPSLVTIETLYGPRQTLEWAMYKAARANPDKPNGAGEPGYDYADDGSGSGLVIDSRGYILTCHHVVAEAEEIYVRLADGRRFKPVEVRTDPVTDFALIRIDGAGKLPQVSLAGSAELQIGDWVLSIGNPYDLGPSISAGVVSATDRHLSDSATRLIQTDAVTNPGVSGGALVNLRGEVVGVVEGGYGSDIGFQGIGFAIPARDAHRIGKQLLRTKSVQRAVLGCQTESISPRIIRQLGYTGRHGIIVCNVLPKSPASEAGIQIGDILTHFGMLPIRDEIKMYELLENAASDGRNTVTVFRQGKRITLDLRFQPPNVDIPESHNTTSEPPQRTGYHDKLLGLVVAELSPDLAADLGFDRTTQGVLVTGVSWGSTACKERVYAGMVIRRVQGKPVRNLDEYRSAIEGQSLDKGIITLVGTPQGNHFIVFGR